MTTSLRDRRRRDSLRARYEAPPVLRDPRQALGLPTGRGRSGLYEPRRRPRLSPVDTLIVLAVAAVALFLLHTLWSATRVHMTSTGLDRHDALTYGEARRIDVRIHVRPTSGLAGSRLLLDGQPLDAAEKLDDGYRWRSKGPLTNGAHRLELRVPRPVLPQSRFRWDFVVDATPPALTVADHVRPHRVDQPLVLRGRLDADARLTASGEPVEVDDDGRFTLRYDRPPAGPIVLAARDDAGHVVKHKVFVPIERPPVHGVHMSAISWRTKDLRQGVFDLIDAHKIDTVELDLKDEGGEVGYDSKVPLAQRIGSVKRYYEIHDAVRELHRRGVRVIGRLVVFRDPILAEAAWREGNHDWVVQRPDGKPHGAYGGFTNMAAAEVRRYNLDIAAEAIAAGIDEILWDYIRRPEGDLTQIVFPGMASTDAAVEQHVVQFLSAGHELVRSKGVFQGASVFGIAAGDPAAVGQNVPQIAQHVDYLAPMVYPSLWVEGEYRVPDPTHMPYTIVARSLQDFKAKSVGTRVHFTPWLQDFSLGAPYGDAEVRQQIDGAASVDIGEFLLWSPRVRYHPGRLATLKR